MNEPDNYKKGLERLRAQYKDGLDFIVLTPVFVTLRQQTLQRLQDAGLSNSDGSDPKVLPYAFSAEFTVSMQPGLCNPFNTGQVHYHTCAFVARCDSMGSLSMQQSCTQADQL